MATQTGSEHGATAQAATTAHGRTAHVTHHGNSVAAWTLVLGCMLGALVAAVGICVPSTVLIVVGAVIAVIALIAGKVLSLAGYGTVKPADPETPHGVA